MWHRTERQTDKVDRWTDCRERVLQLTRRTASNFWSSGTVAGSLSPGVMSCTMQHYNAKLHGLLLYDNTCHDYNSTTHNTAARNSETQHAMIFHSTAVLSGMEKPTRSDSYPNPLRLTECLLSLTESYWVLTESYWVLLVRVGIASGRFVHPWCFDHMPGPGRAGQIPEAH